MNMREAIAKKILNICKDRNISINKLATMCCLTQSTLQNIVAGHSNNPKIATIYKICEGLNITLGEFFSDELFKNIKDE